MERKGKKRKEKEKKWFSGKGWDCGDSDGVHGVTSIVEMFWYYKVRVKNSRIEHIELSEK